MPLLVIREDQLRAESERSRRDFELRLVEHLRRKYPARTKPLVRGELEDIVSEGIDRALGYDVRAEADVAAFLELMLEIDLEFERIAEYAWAHAILTHDTLPGSAKIRLIRARLAE